MAGREPGMVDRERGMADREPGMASACPIIVSTNLMKLMSNDMIYNSTTKKWESPYWHPAVTTDTVVFGLEGTRLSVLLIERGGEPFKGAWALPGGFLEDSDASAEAAARRELYEETHLEGLSLEQLHTFAQAGRDPRERVVSIAFTAVVPKERYQPQGGDDARQAQWFTIDALPPLAFDHASIIDMAIKRLRQCLQMESIGTGLAYNSVDRALLQAAVSHSDDQHRHF